MRGTMLCRGSGKEVPDSYPNQQGRSTHHLGSDRGLWRSSCSTKSDSIGSSFAGVSKWPSGY
jgi:hypothetical protein